MAYQLILVAGASGDLGGRITAAVLARAGSVRALIHPETHADAPDELPSHGAEVVAANWSDLAAGASACSDVRSGRRAVHQHRHAAHDARRGSVGRPLYFAADDDVIGTMANRADVDLRPSSPPPLHSTR